MGFPLDNHTLLYLTIGLFIVQIFIMRYYVSYSVEDSQYKSNKKMEKKLGMQINTTFDKYMGSQQPVSPVERSGVRNNRNNRDNRYTGGYDDSVADPVDENEECQPDRPDEHDEYNEVGEFNGHGDSDDQYVQADDTNN